MIPDPIERPNGGYNLPYWPRFGYIHGEGSNRLDELFTLIVAVDHIR